MRVPQIEEKERKNKGDPYHIAIDRKLPDISFV